MNPILLSPIPLALTLNIALGVLIHDTQLDMAAKTILSAPIVTVNNVGDELSMKFNDPHSHSENLSASDHIREINGDQPRTQTRGDDKKYVIQKKSNVHSFGSEYIWPST